MKAVILKGIGGFYYVKYGGEVYECRARGKFRADGIKPVPGDEVHYADGDEHGICRGDTPEA